MVMSREQLNEARNKLWGPIVVEDLSVCYNCKAKGLKEEDVFCPNCRFPQRGSQEEMRTFLQNVNLRHQLVIEKSKKIKTARILLFVFAALNLLSGVYLYNQFHKEPAFLIVGGAFALIFVALGLWSKKKPFAAIITGFFIYVLGIVINAIGDPNTLYQGLLWKAIFISGFVYGIFAAKESVRLEAEINSVAEHLDFTEQK